MKGVNSKCRNKDLYEYIFVHFIWVVMTFAMISVVFNYGSRIPRKDDSSITQYLADGGKPTPQWLWKQTDVSRFPVSKFLMWFTFKVSNGDLRFQMLLGILAMSFAAFISVKGLRSIFQKQNYSDAVIPLLLLNFGHMEVFLWFMPVVHASLASMCTIIIITYCFCDKWKTSSKLTLLTCFCLIILPLQSILGLIPALGLSVSSCVLALSRRQTFESLQRKNSYYLLFSSVICMVLICLYFINFDYSENQSQRGINLAGAFVSMIKTISMSMGPISNRIWPISGFLVVFTLATLIKILTEKKQDRSNLYSKEHIVSLLCILSMLMLALAIGWGRQWQTSLYDRYGFYMAPLFLSLYYAWSRSNAFNKFVRIILFTCISSSIFYHAQRGIDKAQQIKTATIAFERDVDNELPLTGLVARHSHFWAGKEEEFEQLLKSLKNAGIPPFQKIKSDHHFIKKTINLTDLSFDGLIQIDDNTLECKQDNGWLRWDLDDERKTLAIRIFYTLHNSSNFTLMEYSTSKSQSYGKAPVSIKVNFNPNKQQKVESQTFWIDEKIENFTLSPSKKPYTISIHSVEHLLAP